MFRATQQWLSSRVAGGHMRHITGTCKAGRGKVHLRSILGSRGRFKKFMKTHGIRDGAPGAYNQTRKGLGIKLGYGGLFGARRSRAGEGRRTESAEEIEGRLFGHPNITNAYNGKLELHPDLAGVSAGAPLKLSLVIALPRFKFNPNFTPTKTAVSDKDNAAAAKNARKQQRALLPKTWRAALAPLTELVAGRLAPERYGATGSASVVLATSKASVGLRFVAPSAADEAEGRHAYELSAYEILEASSPSVSASNHLSGDAPTTVVADRQPTCSLALVSAMHALLRAHTAAAHTAVRVVVTPPEAAKRSEQQQQQQQQQKIRSASSSKDSAPAEMPATLANRRRQSLSFGAPSSSPSAASSSTLSAASSQKKGKKVHAPAAVSVAATPTTPNTSAAVASKPPAAAIGGGVFAVVKALRDGAEVFGGNGASEAATATGRPLPALAVGTCLRVEPDWAAAFPSADHSSFSSPQRGSSLEEPTADAASESPQVPTPSTSRGGLDRSTRAALRAAFLTAARQHGLASASGATSSTNSTSSAADPLRLHHADFSAVRSASLSATSVQSGGAKRTGFVTLTPALPIATLCQWSYRTADARKPLASRQVIIDLGGSGGSGGGVNNSGFEGPATLSGVLAADGTITVPVARSQRRQRQRQSSRALVSEALSSHGGDIAGGSSAVCGRTWQQPKTRPANLIASAVMASRTISVATALATSKRGASSSSAHVSESAALRAASGAGNAVAPLSIVMLVRCFVPQQLQRHDNVNDSNSDNGRQSTGGEDTAFSSSLTSRAGDEGATTRLGAAAFPTDGDADAPTQFAPNPAVAVSEWRVAEMLAGFSQQGNGGNSGLSRTMRKNFFSHGGAPVTAADGIDGEEAAAAVDRSFSTGDVLVGSPIADALVLGGGSGRNSNAASTAAGGDDRRRKRGTYGAGRASAAEEGGVAAVAEGGAESEEAVAKAPMMRRKRPASPTASSSAVAAASMSEKRRHSSSVISPRTHASAPCCPLVAYVSDEVRNPTTAYLRRTLDVRPIVEDAFAAVDSVAVWHRAIHRGGASADSELFATHQQR